MGEWRSLDGWQGPTWVCKNRHRHRGTRADGSPCTYKKKRAEMPKRQQTNFAELMGSGTRRALPKRISGVVRGGLPSLGKKR